MYIIMVQMTKTFIVLGMHRSATSLVAGGLKRMGVNMGNKLLGADESNLFGHFEDKKFMELNKKILRKAGGSWDNPPAEANIIKAGKELLKEIKELTNKIGLWGWKDPRTTLTIKCYLPYLENPHFICCFREPSEVAKSLRIREGWSINKGIELTREYNKRLLQFLEETTK